MDLRKVKKLIELVEESGITELEVKSGDEAVRIARGISGVVMSQPVAPPAAALPGAPAVAPAAVATADSTLRAPMAGTFYQAPEPGAEPYVSVGQRVEVGTVVAIIESMKMMNEIRAEVAGTVSAIEVADGEPVSSDQVLMRISQ